MDVMRNLGPERHKNLQGLKYLQVAALTLKDGGHNARRFFLLPALKLPIPSLASAHCKCIKGIH